MKRTVYAPSCVSSRVTFCIAQKEKGKEKKVTRAMKKEVARSCTLCSDVCMRMQ